MRESLLAIAARTSPAPWLIVASVLAGLGVASLTRRARPGEHGDGARTRRGVLFAVSMSGAVLLALLGVFVPGPARILDLKYLFGFLGASAVAAAGFRFPRTAGLVLLLAALIAGSAAYLFSTALRPLTGDTEAGTVLASARADGGMDVELLAPGRPPIAGRLEGDTVVPLIREILFDDLWPGLGWRRWYRLEGLSAFSPPARDGRGGAPVRWSAEPLRFAPERTVSELLYAAFAERAGSLPGVRVRRSEEAAESAFRTDPDGRSGKVRGVERLRILIPEEGGYLLLPAEDRGAASKVRK